MVVAAPIDRYAKRIARDLTRGRAPSLTDEIAAYLGSGPEAIFDNLKGLLDRIANNSDEALTGAHLALLSMQLEFLSYRIDLGHREAIDLQTAFEERVAALVRESESPGLVLGLVGAAIHQAKLAAGPVLRALQQETLDDEAKDLDAELDIQSALSEVAEGCGGDVFAIIESLTEVTHAMPAEARPLFAQQMLAGADPVMREAAALLSLDPDEGVRRAVAAMLAANAGPLTPTALRRLIAIRNWIPAKEQLAIDEAIRVARSSGVACASWRQATATDIRASGIDGSGAAGFAMVSPAGGKHRFSSIVFRFGEGVIDAWSTEPMAKGRLRGMLREAEGTMLRSVPRRHLDLVAQHYLAVGRERSAVPPLGLLQVAEAIGAAEWRPARLDWEATLETLIAELPRTLREPTRIERTMKDSVAWAAEDTVSASWFENDQDVVDLVAKLPASEKAVDYVLTTVVERRKLKWAERFLWMALWFKESGLGGRWPHYALLAHELARGRPVDSIPLMRMIASNTLICAGDAVWIEDGR
jgi:hypothetical protein